MRLLALQRGKQRSRDAVQCKHKMAEEIRRLGEELPVWGVVVIAYRHTSAVFVISARSFDWLRTDWERNCLFFYWNRQRGRGMELLRLWRMKRSSVFSQNSRLVFPRALKCQSDTAFKLCSMRVWVCGHSVSVDKAKDYLMWVQKTMGQDSEPWCNAKLKRYLEM